MEEKIKFVRSVGRMIKRRTSSVKIEFESTHVFHLVTGDELVLTMVDKTDKNTVEVKIIVNSILNIYPGNKVKIEFELSPTNASIFVKK